MAHVSRFQHPLAEPLEQGISVVVPAYNSETSLPELAARLQAVLKTQAGPYELILVNDGSRDRTWPVIQALAARHGFVRGVNLMRNYGQHNALLCGIRLARYPDKEQHGFWRNLSSQVTKLVLQSAMGAETARRVSAFRAFRTAVREGFADAPGPFIAIDVLLTWGTNRFAWIPVREDRRKFGRSTYTVRKLIVHAMNLMTGFSTLPLQVVSLLGFGCTVFGVLVLTYVLGRYLIHGGQVPGFSFLASTIAIFSGAQLFALGIFGEYLGRVHARTMERPAYAIDELTATRDEAAA